MATTIRTAMQAIAATATPMLMSVGVGVGRCDDIIDSTPKH
jgi:hypothetical protein